MPRLGKSGSGGVRRRDSSVAPHTSARLRLLVASSSGLEAVSQRLEGGRGGGDESMWAEAQQNALEWSKVKSSRDRSRSERVSLDKLRGRLLRHTQDRDERGRERESGGRGLVRFKVSSHQAAALPGEVHF